VKDCVNIFLPLNLDLHLQDDSTDTPYITNNWANTQVTLEQKKSNFFLLKLKSIIFFAKIFRRFAI
jgi:hypothetical protein